MANPFLIQPTALQGLSGLAQTVGQVRKEEEALRQQEKAKSDIQAALQAGDTQALQNLSIQYPQFAEQIKNFMPQTVEQEPFQQVKTEGLEGYVFNPNTGEYSINQNLKAKLDAVKSGEVELDAKTRQGIQKDITQLTKDTKLIRNTAQDLDKLADMKSGPASIAMVFKFMKALDPTSVVREGEFATAENSAGIPEAVRNIYNKLTTGERLGEKQTQEFVNTAKQLANTAIESSTGEVTSFLDTFEETIPKGFKNLTLKRIPQTFEIEEIEQEPIAEEILQVAPVIKAHPVYGDVTEEDIQETMRANNMTREEVLAKLGG